MASHEWERAPSSLSMRLCNAPPQMCVQVRYERPGCVSQYRCSTRLRNSSSCGWSEREKGGTRGRQTIDERGGSAGGWLQSDEPLPSICLVNQLEKSTQPTDDGRTNAVQQCFSPVNAHLESLATTHHCVQKWHNRALKSVSVTGPYCGSPSLRQVVRGWRELKLK